MLNIYRASAGSGKTFQLTKDYIFLLFDTSIKQSQPRPHRRILAVTFTNKATEEMKSRILKELHLLSLGEKSDYRADLMEEFKLPEAEVNARAKQILTNILHDFSSFSISTIDKFFQQVVRSFAREIGVNGGYNIELDTNLTLQQALDNLYNDLSEKGNEQLLGWMTDFLQEQIEDGKSWRVDKDIMGLGKEIFKENYQHKAVEIRKKLTDKDFLKAYRAKLRKIQTDFDKNIKTLAQDALDFLENNGIQPDYFSRSMMHSTLTGLQNQKYEIGSTFLKYLEGPESCYTKKSASHVKSAIDSVYYNGLQERLLRIIEFLDKGATGYNSSKIILRHINTLGILTDLAMQIGKLTSEKNIMLLSDTNLLLNKIIDDSETPFVYERTGVNIDHYMIDEFQDTSVLQWKNFKPLIANSLATDKKNMLVGDVKQSIYRWRNSDWKLLDRQVFSDFASSNPSQKTLETNWRSDRNIIEFNNSFFKKASDLLQEKLNENIGDTKELEHLKTVISSAYADVAQQVSKKASEGFVQVKFVKKDGVKADWAQSVLEQIPPLLESLVDRGFKPNDVAFLVRKNDEAIALTNFLLTYKNSPEARPGFSYEVVGNEGLTVNSSHAVNFIIAVLKLIFNPKDDVNRTIMQFEYQIGKLKRTEDEAVRMSFSEEEKLSAQSALFSEEENNCIDDISRLALYEATEKLISVFELEKWHHETAILQAFQDVVFKFSTNYNADLNSFLRWWDENGEKQYINAPENENAFRVMTVHKAKGLDFKVVIVPFCNWEMDAVKKKPLLWCETTEKPFDELPLIPVQYNSILENSIFSREYFDEQMHQFVDNLNVTYVAFTRARNEMYCFAEAGTDTTLKKLTKISDLMQVALSNDLKIDENSEDEQLIFELGKPTTAVYKDEQKDTSDEKRNSYPITDSSSRLKIRHTSADYWKTAPISESRVNYGTIMHEILQKTIRRGDEEKAVSEQLSAGKISETDLPVVREELERFWSQPEVNEWFIPDLDVLNETDILLPSGEKYRPDRVILLHNKATIIDYKFSKEERAFYTNQLQRYAGFLQEMGCEDVKGYLYYVRLGKVVKV